jgi:hypothetical protein
LDVALLGELDGWFDPVSRISSTRADPDGFQGALSSIIQSGKTPKSTQAIVITTDAPNRKGMANF